MTNPEPLDCAWPLALRFTTVTTVGRSSLTTSTTGSAPAGTCAGATVGSALGDGSMKVAGGRPPSTLAAAPPAMPPRTTPTRRSAAALPLDRVVFVTGLPPDAGSGFACGGGGLAAAGRRSRDLRLDHLTDRGTADLEVDVTVGFDLDLLVHALESLLRVRHRVDRLRADERRRIDRERDVEVLRFGVHEQLSDVADLHRLRDRRLARTQRDDVGALVLTHETEIRRARERQLDRLFAVVAQAVAHSRGEPLVGDADVLADPEARHRRERADRRLEREAHGPRFTLGGERVIHRVQAHRLVASDAEAVLEERAPRRIVVEQLRQTALLRTDRLVDRLRFLLRGPAYQHLARLLGATQVLVLGFGPPRERVDEIRRRCVDVPLDHGAALHVHEHRASVPAEDVLVVAVDVVVALLAGGDATLREDSLGLEQRRVRVRAQVREVDTAEHAVPVHVVALRAPQVLLRLPNLLRAIEDAAASELLRHDEHALVQRVRFGILREEVAPEWRGHERLQVLAELVARLRVAPRGSRVECPRAHLGIRAAG